MRLRIIGCDVMKLGTGTPQHGRGGPEQAEPLTERDLETEPDRGQL